MARANNRSEIIIKKFKKNRLGRRPSSAWKIAYADFVTAMMAFFLLMWLLNTATEEQKMGLADYFAPSVVTGSADGADGVLGGTSITVDGNLKNDASPIEITITLPAEDEEWEGETLAVNAGDGDGAQGDKPQLQEEAKKEQERPARTASPLTDQRTLDALLEEQESKRFSETEEAIAESLENDPALIELKNNLIFDRTPEGLRIQIVDHGGTSMFPSGSSEMFTHTKALIGKVVDAINRLENKVALKGHTDATPYRGRVGYSNWELSTDRANASRRALVEAGLDPARIESVIGRADQEPFVEGNPYSPQNRRISIILLRSRPLVEIPRFEDGRG